MGLFGNKNRYPTYLPESYLRGLREYGEHLSGRPGGFNDSLIADLDMLDFLTANPQGFVELLAAAIPTSPDAGAFCLGAADAVTVVHARGVPSRAWDRITDEAIAHLRAMRVPYEQTKPYMRARWQVAHGPADW
ncbi:hypothetical protein ACFFX1_34110 [Dactylosporangium sucinum]|uniref:Uncharacterized protein n=1 Tax=Dactylosporangium sucinum TaxID=1424081 RepID=A0A917X6E3_9ACTN|nr:hypothetical protein [Dactylosporangium sucinum]GGM86441.1 hypothetical protein GCM10007977_105410 [Dactylosporangium sucinum]